ncbi:GntR family transcriptional regulator [Paenibacillus sacheonensis]|uniref:FCD domain-containing protein n=1 Tax=Paenibacillus sacheonensis TaxID=742054 RepID=A0A7X4YN36_9BACL|nr:GntR family transcriptional regulator [Paenibacillus sacheonensis]MBM7568348.1 DNA-binding GntR family transcriptional regulator [Paenibacillus sacheonensis]NBC68469.1 FCD domain-containing protein [Paenibacillus sacheonensis]
MSKPEGAMTLRETAFQVMKQHIVNGEWPGGMFLSEKYLSELLGMSKTPIRSAFDRLEMMGLVKLSPKQGVFVQELSLKKILEFYELRMSLETYAVRKLTGRMDAEFFRRLDENIELQGEAIRQDDISRYVGLDREFHAMIVGGLDNEEYMEVMSRIQDKFLLVVRMTFVKNKRRLIGSIDEHRQIRDALAGQDAALSARLIEAHIEYVKKIMF